MRGVILNDLKDARHLIKYFDWKGCLFLLGLYDKVLQSEMNHDHDMSPTFFSKSHHFSVKVIIFHWKFTFFTQSYYFSWQIIIFCPFICHIFHMMHIYEFFDARRNGRGHHFSWVLVVIKIFTRHSEQRIFIRETFFYFSN